MSDIIQRAKDFATERHHGQLRDGGAPFITHPMQTAQILSLVTSDENLIAAGWLHDTIEDTDTTYTELVATFNSDIADLVMEVTQEGTSGNRYFPHLHTRRGIMLKFADRLTNISDMKDWSNQRKQKYLADSTFWKASAA